MASTGGLVERGAGTRWREAATSERSGRPVGRLTPLPILLRLGVVAGLAVLLAMTAAGSKARVGRGPSVGSAAVRLGLDALEFLAVVALLGGLALLVVGVPRLRRRRPDDEPEWVVERPPIPWYAKLLMLGLVLIVLAGLAGSLLVVRHQFEERPVAPPASTGPVSPRAPSSIPATGGSPPAAGKPLTPVVWAVVAAYARMLAVLGRLGVPRRTAEAPLEYLRRVLGSLEGDPEPARRLTDLFQRAEFSRQPVTEGMRAEAIQALDSVRERLGARA